MENASKALIIAGAVLLAIAIIGIGMFIFGRSRDVVLSSGDQVSNMGIKLHNQQFTQYEGKEKRYEEIKAMVTKIQASNNSNTTSSYQVRLRTLSYTDAANTTPGNMCHNLTGGNVYQVINDCGNFYNKKRFHDIVLYYSPEGIINQIDIIARN